MSFAEFMQGDIDEILSRFATEDGREPTEDDSLQSTLDHYYRTYAAIPEEAGRQAAVIVQELPRYRAKGEIAPLPDALLGYTILRDARAALKNIIGEDAEMDKMLDDVAGTSDRFDELIRQSARQFDPDSTADRDRQIRQSADSDQRASDAEIASQAGNSAKNDDAVRDSAQTSDDGTAMPSKIEIDGGDATNPPEAPSNTSGDDNDDLQELDELLEAEADEMIAEAQEPPKKIVIQTLDTRRMPPIQAFTEATRWLAEYIIKVGGGDANMKLTRLRPLMESGDISPDDVEDMIRDIATLTAQLKPPTDDHDTSQ